MVSGSAKVLFAVPQEPLHLRLLQVPIASYAFCAAKSAKSKSILCFCRTGAQ
jgi:hypothetical protein